jgi:hypothetical protein
MRKYIAYTLLMLTASSCAVTTKTVNVDVLIPSAERVSLSNNERIMVIANYKSHSKLISNHVSAFVDDSLQVAKTVNGFNDYFCSLGTSAQKYVHVIYRPIPKDEPDILTSEEIKRYTQLENPKYIIELSLLRTLIKKESPSSYKVTYASLWDIYDAEKGSLIRELIDKDSLYYDQYEKVSRSELDSIIADNVAYNISQRIGYSVFPFWQEQYRYYLMVLDPQFQKVDELIQTFKWKEVISLMQGFLSSSDKNDVYAATFNIALACEMMGNLDLAKKWLEKCKKIKNSYVVVSYSEALISRERQEKGASVENDIIEEQR